MKRIVLSAAEPSGDVLGAELFTALRRGGDLEAIGVAGPRMRAAGVQPIAHVEDIAAMGIAEVATKLGPLHRARGALRAAIADGPDALVTIDGPDLHLPLARRAKASGVPALGYVSPQVWAWRSGRIPRIAQSLDLLLCLFKFEPPLYAEAGRTHGMTAQWVGHPVLDRLSPGTRSPEDHFGLLPGSRGQEISRHLSPFLAVAEALRSARPQARFTLVAPPGALPRHHSLPEYVRRATHIDALRGATAALTKSGTVTLELAVMGVPMVIAHRVHPLTYAIGKTFVKGVSHVGLPNILAGSAVAPEFLQDLDVHTLTQAVLNLDPEPQYDLEALGAPGASARAAAAIWARLGTPERPEGLA